MWEIAIKSSLGKLDIPNRKADGVSFGDAVPSVPASVMSA
jgi:hypothetical protein